MTDAWQSQREALGAFIRTQRQMANLSLRQLAALTHLSNGYISQVEQGMYEPSVRVLKQLSDALNISMDTLMVQAGLIDAVAADAVDGGGAAEASSKAPSTEDAIRADERLSEDQRAALIAVYRSMLS